MDATQIISSHIQKNGSIGVSKALEIALYHPQCGYYNNNEIVGINGDFITAPEISQLFGEVIGIWCLWQWQKFNNKDLPLHLIELGPGRGTMMNDLLRILKQTRCNFNISLVEISNILKQKQQHTLLQYLDKCNWYNNLSDVPKNPFFTIILANEFFDALPIQQMLSENERQIVIEEGALNFKQAPIQIHEKCLENSYYMNQIKQHLQPGAALIIDYGDYIKPDLRIGDTLQAVRNHKKVPLLENLGKADISHQVDFYELEQLTLPLMSHFYSQKEFLYKFAIDKRLEILLQNANVTQMRDLKLGIYRLLAPKEMGNLFKVLEVFNYA